ncbi:rRNA-processing protein MPP10 [Aspergillus clavatus NRRL 1]|uniref:U3 small nucleolar ribonucleoprotein protein MPP10 n=1 Tax=Aspergillus clavatus (strain ATCC 1007 / CBS 513.65 / DSM 816 / NCTC 3887 / NRRL 1 / QM 1276 / 107) TaxID=344612 RepID=A1CGP5_ASPCL|nr:U3 small nucleolar ribonucleoprotein Mpp10 [Aspergillus clavatus NRRL 1]EAW10050.1 U3 small nucleolar ribonucleoprotein protein Mpp10 [Aspergillus clavatus NRRL 1]
MKKAISIVHAEPPAFKATSHEQVPLESVLSHPWDFLRPTTSLHASVAKSAKHFLDHLATSVSDSQVARQRISRKRKRSDFEQELSQHALQLRELCVQGFASSQIWEQAIRILDSSEWEIEHDFALLAHSSLELGLSHSRSGTERPEDISQDNDTVLSTEPSIDDSSSQNDDGSDMESIPESRDTPEKNSRLQIELYDDPESEHSSLDFEDKEERGETYQQDPFGLNDGFFSIDEFNKQSELLERQDAKGGAADDVDSDEEEVDWHTNPLAVGNTVSYKVAKQATQGPGKMHTGGSEIDDSDEEGPTFDNAPSQSDSDMDDADAYADEAGGANWINTSDIKYSDFFAPPPRKAIPMKSRPLPKTQPRVAIEEVDLDRAIADVRRDLFEDDISMHESDASHNGISPNTQHSAHEKQRARIADEIRRLEAANVAKKEWMLAGEARGGERPINSLIEEDLDFERIGKPVPVVTTEISEGIEDLVKRRILAKEFDEVIRRRPGASDVQGLKKGRFELEDTKPQQSLAEMFETDHLRTTDPNYIDPKSQKLMKEHTEVSNMWKEISVRLDTLSNWHYKPKAPQATINVVTDVATIMMEDAQPTSSNATLGSAALAPQELYAPGDDGKVAGEVVLRNGGSIAKEEMSREEKSKLRRKYKNERRAHGENSKQHSGKAAEKQQIVSTLKKGGVKLVGKEGGLTDVHGIQARQSGAKTGADLLKL